MSEYAPMYLKMADQIRQRIIDGRYPVGAALPSREELAEEFGTSYTTARSAVRTLQADGIVHSMQGRAAVVLRIPPSASTWVSTDLMQALQDLAAETAQLADRAPRQGVASADLLELNRRVLLINVLADEDAMMGRTREG